MGSITEADKKEIIAEVLASRQNREQVLLKMKERRIKGLEVAQKCAKSLKENYGVKKVVLFGSLLSPEKVHTHSDIDLAVWNLPEEEYFKAVGSLLDIAEDFSIDLVEVQNAKPHIALAIEQGVTL